MGRRLLLLVLKITALAVSVCSAAGQETTTTTTTTTANATTANATNATVPALYNLTDSDFDMMTRAMAGMTAGEFFVAFCCCEDLCPVSTLWHLAETLRDVNSSVHVARVDCDEQLRLAVRFGAVEKSRFLFLKDSRMYAYEATLDNATLWQFLNETSLTLEDGPKVPRRAGPFKPLHDALGDFFDAVDYRILVMAFGVASVALVLIGAFMPHPETEDDKKKKEDDDDDDDPDDKKESSKNNNKRPDSATRGGDKTSAPPPKKTTRKKDD